MMPMLLAWLLAAAAQASGYRIAGVVVNSATRQPVSGARVTIAPVEHRDQRIPFVTGQDGRFVFAGMPPGKYELMGERRGFLPGSYGQRGGFASAIVAGPDQQTGALTLLLAPPGVISGKVVDDAGEPVAQATVELLRSDVVSGRRRLETIAVTHTDDAGAYRFASLGEGSYYLAVSGYPWFTKFNETYGDAAPRNMTHAGYGIRYYPNAGDPAAAAPLLLKAGQEVTADFALLQVAAASLQVNVEQAEELTKQFRLTASGIGGEPVVVREASQEGNSCNFWALPPGHYILRVEAKDANHSWYARESLDVGAADMEIDVNLLEAPSIKGTIALEGGGPLPPDITAALLDTEGNGSVGLPVGAGGRFSAPTVAPQRYRVLVTGPDGYYLKAWSVEGGRREGEILDIAEGSAVRLNLIAAKDAGRANGTVYRDGRPLPGALVVLVPVGPGMPQEPRAVESDSDGSYAFSGLPPGAYAVFAVAEGADLEYANPAAIRPYLGSAEKIRVAPAGVSTQRLDVPGATASRPGAASPES